MVEHAPGLWVRRLVTITLVGSAWLTSLAPTPAPAETFYVAPDGNDANPGTLSKPWRTLKHGIDRVSAGDTLLARGGIYSEHRLTIELRGTGSAPITIGNYPGEAVTLDGSFEEFQSLGNGEWELVDGAVDLYRSKRTYADGEWSGKFEHDGKLYALNEYKSLGALASPRTTFASSGVYYLGPGFLWNSSDKRIYIRLQAPDPDALHGRAFQIPSDPNPRQNKVFIGHHFFGVKFAGAEHVVIDGINIKHFERPLFFGSGHHITVRNAIMVAGKTGALMEDGIRDIVLEGLTIDAGFPAWIAWREVKHSPKPAGSLKLSGLILKGGIDQVRVAHCRFVDVFDGITAIGAPTNLQIVHNEIRVIDDAVQLGSGGAWFEFGYNLTIGPGPGHDGSSDSVAPGTKYIHHNIIDVRREELYGRAGHGSVGWRYHIPFPTHSTSTGGPDPWKIYNNTVLYKTNENNSGAGEDLKGPREGPAHEVYNNIFLQLDDWRPLHASHRSCGHPMLLPDKHVLDVGAQRPSPARPGRPALPPAPSPSVGSARTVRSRSGRPWR